LLNSCLGQNKGNHGRNGLTDPVILRHFVSPVGSSSIYAFNGDAGDAAPSHHWTSDGRKKYLKIGEGLQSKV
jgi:hypothetical protein